MILLGFVAVVGTGANGAGGGVEWIIEIGVGGSSGGGGGSCRV